MDDIYEHNEKYNPNKERGILVAFEEMIADMLSKRKLNKK